MKNKKYKYLRELFPEKLPYPFGEDDYPDFDARDTYNMDVVIAARLYEAFRLFREESIVALDSDYCTWEVDGQQYTLGQCLDRMAEDCAYILKGSKAEMSRKQIQKYVDDLFDILSKVFFALWW